MFTLKTCEHKAMTELRQKFDLERVQKELSDQKNKDSEVKVLRDQITQLQADLKIAKAEAVQAKDRAKAEYAEHVMAVTDQRVEEMRKVYENYTKNIVEIVKAGIHPAPTVNVDATVKTAK